LQFYATNRRDACESLMNAEGVTRTPMPFRAQRPERCVSTNFTTSARMSCGQALYYRNPCDLSIGFSRPLRCQSIFHIASHFDRMGTSRLLCRSTISEEVPEDVHFLSHHLSCAQR